MSAVFRPKMDLTIARAAGQDAGNRSMKAAGRTAWSEEDFGAATAVMRRLLGLQSDDKDTT